MLRPAVRPLGHDEIVRKTFGRPSCRRPSRSARRRPTLICANCSRATSRLSRDAMQRTASGADRLLLALYRPADAAAYPRRTVYRECRIVGAVAIVRPQRLPCFADASGKTLRLFVSSAALWRAVSGCTDFIGSAMCRRRPRLSPSIATLSTRSYDAERDRSTCSTQKPAAARNTSSL